MALNVVAVVPLLGEPHTQRYWAAVDTSTVTSPVTVAPDGIYAGWAAGSDVLMGQNREFALVRAPAALSLYESVPVTPLGTTVKSFKTNGTRAVVGLVIERRTSHTGKRLPDVVAVPTWVMLTTWTVNEE